VTCPRRSRVHSASARDFTIKHLNAGTLKHFLTMEIISKKTVWKGNFMSAVEITYRDAKGVVRTWEALERVGISGIVVMVAVTPDGKVILE